MANNVVATGRMELVDLQDNRQLQLFISSSQPKTQIYNSDNGSYTPDWGTNKPVLSPQLFIAGNSTDIISNAKSIKWYEDGSTTPIVTGSEYTLSTGNKKLTINQNLLANVNAKMLTVEVIHTDVYTGYDVLIKSSISFNKVLSGKKGEIGSAGDNAVIAVLDNDYHGIPTDSAGASGDYSGASSTITIFEGGVDATSSWTITATKSTGITGTLSGRKYSITNMSTDEGYVEIKATRSGYTAVSKRFVVAKSKSGVEGDRGQIGSSATAYWLVSDAQVIVRDEKNEYTPSAVTFTAKSKTGNNSPIDYAGRWQIADSMDGKTYVNRYISGANEESKSYSPRPNIHSLRVRLYLSNGTTLIDEQIISVANNGNQGYEGQDASHAIVWTPNGNTILNGEGEVVAQADLYRGSEIVEAKSYQWVRENPNAISHVAGQGWEDLGYGKKNLRKEELPTRNNSAYSSVEESDEHIIAGTKSFRGISLTDGLTYFRMSHGMSFEKGKTYTGSWYVYDPHNKRGSSSYVDNGGNFTKINEEIISLGNDKYRMSVTIRAESDGLPSHGFLFYMQEHEDGKDVWMSGIKIEEGEVATAWSPAPEEIVLSEDEEFKYRRNILKDTELTHSGVGGAWKNLPSRKTEGGIPYVEQGYAWGILQTIPVMKAGTYTFSVMAKEGTNPDSRVRISKSGGSSYSPIGFLTNEWKLYSDVVVIEEDIENYTIYYLNADSKGDAIIKFKDFMVEKGDKTSSWTPAPEDTIKNKLTASSGENAWIVQSYENTRQDEDYLVDYSIIKDSTLLSETTVSDSSSLLKMNVGDVVYARTAIHSEEIREFNLMLSHSNTIMVYVNGISSFSQSPWLDDGIPIKLNEGWNTVELLWVEKGNTMNINPLLSSQVGDMNCYYALEYGQARGIDGIKGFNTNQISITEKAVVNVENFKCFIDDGEYIYSDTCVVNDVTEPYNIVVFGTSVFKNGQGESQFTAKLYQHGTEVDADDDSGYTYRWYIYNSDDTLYKTWNTVGYKIGKTITVYADDILNEARLVCEVDA